MKYENHIRFFRPCTAEDFTSNGIIFKSEGQKKAMQSRRICPDILKNDPMWAVMNGYTDEEFRQSFSIELWSCNPKYNKCKDDSEIEKFLKKTFYTVYLVSDNALFTDGKA
jgi:hypothetical protein